MNRRRAQQAGWLAYRAEMRETIPEEQLALLEANMPKTFIQSCVDNGIPLKECLEEDLISFDGLAARLQQHESHGRIDWAKKHDGPPCFKPNAATQDAVWACLMLTAARWCPDDEEEID